LLLDAITGSSSRTDSTEVSHGGVRLQLGATLRQVDLQLMRPAARGPEHAANAAATASTLVMPTAPHIVGAAADPRIPFFHLRLRDLVLRYQRRARGGSRLRVAAMPLEAYDLRGALRVQTIGVAGKRVHGPIPAGSLHLHEPPMGRPAPGSRGTVGTDGVASQDWAWAAAHSRYPNGAVSPRSTSSSPPMSPQSSLAEYPLSPRPSPSTGSRPPPPPPPPPPQQQQQQQSLAQSVGRGWLDGWRTRKEAANERTSTILEGAESIGTVVRAVIAVGKQGRVSLALTTARAPNWSSPTLSVMHVTGDAACASVGSESAPLSKRILPSWRWRTGKPFARSYTPLEAKRASLVQKVVRGWLARRGAARLKTLHHLLQFSTEWLRWAQHDRNLGGSQRSTQGPQWVVRFEKFPDGALVHSELSVVVPTPIEIV
jgi:hypothetical protein